MAKARRGWWSPRYEGRKSAFVVDGVAAGECPVGLITPQSRQLVQIAERARYAGASLYGPDLSQWPARMVDAFVTIEQERNREQNARMRAEMESD